MRLSQILLATGLVFGSQTVAFAIEPGAPDRLLSYDTIIADQLQEALSAKPAKKDDAAGKAVEEFYASRNYQPLWVGRSGLGSAAQRLIDEIGRADEYGLEVDKFDLPVSSDVDGDSLVSVSKSVSDELLLTRTVLKYAVHARGGRIDPRSLSVYLDRGAYPVPPAKVLASVAETSRPDEYLRSLHPQHEEFKRLRQRYVALLKQGGAEKTVRLPKGPSLSLGKRHKQVALLRERLSRPVPELRQTLATDEDGNAAEDGAVTDAAELAETFDAALDEAVRAFQKKNGLKVDGVVGPGTRAALNGDGVDQMKRLRVNLERWRWMPEDLGDMYVWANVPDYKFYVIKNGRIIHSERIVVGKYTNQTATFSDTMEEIVFNPRWNVPLSIKRNELLPKLIASPGSLARQGLRMQYRGRTINPASVDWSRSNIANYHVYQPSGPRNALGQVKFLFPNKHAIYMHDTPSKSLFNRNVRTFSHGCVRVRDPKRFAEVILAADQGLSRSEIHSRINGGQRNSVFLKNKLPVHITYFTARADGEDADDIRYLRDPYKHDNRISLALAGKPPAYIGPNTFRKPYKPRAVAKKKKKNLFWAETLFGFN